ncbi:hypothetical protein KCP71_09170 [Salmonella enterica subsp. enterica]|nr:hypothetical protein KCP71_09170 [Salmonella enterica subsp. enterica]
MICSNSNKSEPDNPAPGYDSSPPLPLPARARAAWSRPGDGCVDTGAAARRWLSNPRRRIRHWRRRPHRIRKTTPAASSASGAHWRRGEHSSGVISWRRYDRLPQQRQIAQTLQTRGWTCLNDGISALVCPA